MERCAHSDTARRWGATAESFARQSASLAIASIQASGTGLARGNSTWSHALGPTVDHLRAGPDGWSKISASFFSNGLRF